MRICFLAEANVIHTEKWARYFAAQGYEIHVISLGWKKIENVQVHTLLKFPFLGKLNYLLNIPVARKKIAKLKPDIVHVHHASSYGLLGWLSCRDLPLVVTCHGSDVLVFPSNIAARMILTAIFRRANLITSVARHITDKILEFGIEPEKVKTFQYGLDLAAIAAISPRKIHDGVTLISTRQLKQIYNYELLIQSVLILKNSLRNFRVLIVGDGPEEMPLKQMVLDLDLQDDIIFSGALPHSEVIALLKGADIFISTSLSDGTSMCLLEAFACKIVPVVTDIQANRELIVNRKNGFLVSPYSPNELAETVLEALECQYQGNIIEYNYSYILSEQDCTKNFSIMDKLYHKMISSAQAAP